MSDWTITIEGPCPGIDEDLADRLVDALKEYAVAVSYGEDTVGLTITSDDRLMPDLALRRIADALQYHILDR